MGHFSRTQIKITTSTLQLKPGPLEDNQGPLRSGPCLSVLIHFSYFLRFLYESECTHVHMEVGGEPEGQRPKPVPR